jgi:hypothetical protein
MIVVFYACKNAETKNKYPAIDVIGYIKGQIMVLDSVPYGLLKITERSGQNSDSIYLNKKTFIEHVSPFLHASIEKKRLEEDYEETSFADASIGYIVITYQANSPRVPINQVVVYVKPDNSTIYQVYISGSLNPNKTNERNQLLWTHNKGCTIITSDNHDKAEPSSITEKIIWQ